MKTIRPVVLAAALSAGLLALAFLPAAHARPEGPDSAPQQNRKLPRSACQALIAGGVVPDTLRLCDTAQVTLTLGITCPLALPVHVVFAVDRSRSIAQNDQFMSAIRRSAGQVLGELDFNNPDTMAGVLSHGFEVKTEAALSNNRGRAQSGVNGVQYDNNDFGEDPAKAVEVAQRMLNDERGNSSPLELIVLYGDGCDVTVPGCPAASRRAAAAAKGVGIAVATVCFKDSTRANCDDYRAMASEPGLYFESPAGRLPRAVGDLVDLGRKLEVSTVDLTEVLAPGIQLVAGSVQPPGTVQGQQIKFPSWRRVKPGTTLSVTYQVRATTAGMSPLRAPEASVELVDNIDRWSGVLPLPSSAITLTGSCEAPTATPTDPPPSTATPTATETEPATPVSTVSATPSATFTPTATALPSATRTSVPGVAYLPLLLRAACKPQDVHTDVVIALDASTSMLQASGATTKLAAAKAAAQSFVNLLNLGPDQAAVVGFNSEATLAQALTADGAALRAAIDGLTVRQGTRIDLALDRAGDELASPRGRPDNNRVIVLLTDGRQDGEDAASVVTVANTVKARGVVVYTIGLGADVDAALLRQVASSPDTYFFSPDSADLQAIYRQIAFTLPCPGGGLWGQ